MCSSTKNINCCNNNFVLRVCFAVKNYIMTFNTNDDLFQ